MFSFPFEMFLRCCAWGPGGPVAIAGVNPLLVLCSLYFWLPFSRGWWTTCPVRRSPLKNSELHLCGLFFMFVAQKKKIRDLWKLFVNLLFLCWYKIKPLFLILCRWWQFFLSCSESLHFMTLLKWLVEQLFNCQTKYSSDIKHVYWAA